MRYVDFAGMLPDAEVLFCYLPIEFDGNFTPSCNPVGIRLKSGDLIDVEWDAIGGNFITQRLILNPQYGYCRGRGFRSHSVASVIKDVKALAGLEVDNG